jgi:hypothetical protein
VLLMDLHLHYMGMNLNWTCLHYSIETVLHLDVSTPQRPEMHLDVSTLSLQRPVLHLTYLPHGGLNQIFVSNNWRVSFHAMGNDASLAIFDTREQTKISRDYFVFSWEFIRFNLDF